MFKSIGIIDGNYGFTVFTPIYIEFNQSTS